LHLSCVQIKIWIFSLRFDAQIFCGLFSFFKERNQKRERNFPKVNCLYLSLFQFQILVNMMRRKLISTSEKKKFVEVNIVSNRPRSIPTPLEVGFQSRAPSTRLCTDQKLGRVSETHQGARRALRL